MQEEKLLRGPRPKSLAIQKVESLHRSLPDASRLLFRGSNEDEDEDMFAID